MKDCKTNKTYENGVFETLDYMENKIKDVIENLMKQNEENLEHANTSYDEGYYHGIHDGLLDILYELEIKTDEEEYYN